jgi:glucokinase
MRQVGPARPGWVSVGVDLGGTGSRFAVVSERRVVAQQTVPTAELGAGPPPERVARLASVLRGLVPTGSRLSGIGIGASGPVRLPEGIISNLDTLPWFSDFDLGALLGAELGVGVTIDNDAVAAALGEYHYGAGRGFDRLLVVTLGTGVGAALLSDGRPFRDGNGQHPECAHLPVSAGGERCYCGRLGCWESSASRRSLERRVEDVIGVPDLTQAHQLLRAGHPELRAALAEYGRMVAKGLDILNMAYGPGRIVLCGSVSQLLPYFAEALAAELKTAPGTGNQGQPGNQVQIVGSALGDVAGAVGATVLVERGS